eukprot:3802931-Ditylum_brightwellii.AAC.1
MPVKFYSLPLQDMNPGCSIPAATQNLWTMCWDRLSFQNRSLKQLIAQQYMPLPLSADIIAIWHMQYVMVQFILVDLNSPRCITYKE